MTGNTPEKVLKKEGDYNTIQLLPSPRQPKKYRANRQ
jgi:hypothetical protein